MSDPIDIVERLQAEGAKRMVEAHSAAAVASGVLCHEAAAEITRLRAALAQPVPAGWQVVPMEPTFAMCIAGDEARHNVDDLTRTPAIYRAMLAAAPQAPQPKG